MNISRYKTLLNQLLTMCHLTPKPVSNSFKTVNTSEYMRQRDLFIRGRKLYMNELYLNPEIGEYERVVMEAGIDAYNQELLLLDAKKELKLIQA